MDEVDILRIIDDFASAAAICKEGGLDGLEIIAPGHLMDQFWSPVTNQRSDSYGGSLDNRMAAQPYGLRGDARGGRPRFRAWRQDGNDRTGP